MRLMSARGDTVSVIGRSEPADVDSELTNTRYWTADLLDLGTTEKVLNEIVAANGKINYLVFCQRYRGKEDDWLGEFNVTLNATKKMVETLESEFVPDGDRSIVMVSSVFGDFVGEGQAISYHIGKAGLNHMARYYAVNLGRNGIRANVVTTFTFLKEESREFYLNNKELHNLYKDIIPLGRMGTTEDSAQVIGFLCSLASSFVNGQNIYVDGGLSLVWPETIARRLTSL